MPSATTAAPVTPPAPAGRPRRRGLGPASFARDYGALTALVALVLFNIAATPGFLSLNNILYVQLRQAAPVAIVALGMALVITTGGIDLSVGAVMAIAGQIGALTVVAGVPPVLCVVLALLAAAAAGVFNGTLVARFGVQPIIATLILFIAGRGVAQLLTDGRLVNVRNPTFEFLGLGAVALVPIQVVVLIVVLAVVSFVVRSTPYGRHLVATGGNPPAARLSGVPVRRTKLLAYVSAAVLAGFVGLMEVGRISAADANNVGLGMELDAIAAVAVAGTSLAGGRITPVRVVIGALMLRLLQNTLISQGAPREVAQMVTGLIIVAAIVIQRRAGGAR